MPYLIWIPAFLQDHTTPEVGVDRSEVQGARSNWRLQAYENLILETDSPIMTVTCTSPFDIGGVRDRTSE